MSRYFFKQLCVCLLLGYVYCQSAIAADYYYMFKDRNGRMLIQDSIPAEYAHLGYKIVNDQGITIKVVPSVAEQKRKARLEKQKTRTQKANDNQQKKDEELLRTFTGLEDIREHGNRKIKELQGQIDIAKSHVQAFETNLLKLLEQAKRYKDTQNTIPEEKLKAIEQVKEGIAQNNAFIERQRAEQQKVREQHLDYIRRYQEIEQREKLSKVD